MTRAELRVSVLDALNRKDLSAVANVWVTSATTRVNTALRHRQMLKHKILAITSKVFATPADFIIAETVKINRDVSGGFITAGAGLGELLYCPPDELAQMASNAPNAGLLPEFYTTHGLQIELAPWRAAGDYQVDLWYYGKITLAPDDNATNFFLTDYPHVYLNACMAFGHRFLLEHDTALGYEALFGAEMQAINDSEALAKQGNGPLVLRPSRRMGGRFS
jgi:hypothetical protein